MINGYYCVTLMSNRQEWQEIRAGERRIEREIKSPYWLKQLRENPPKKAHLAFENRRLVFEVLKCEESRAQSGIFIYTLGRLISDGYFTKDHNFVEYRTSKSNETGKNK